MKKVQANLYKKPITGNTKNIRGGREKKERKRIYEQKNIQIRESQKYTRQQVLLRGAMQK